MRKLWKTEEIKITYNHTHKNRLLNICLDIFFWMHTHTDINFY